MSASDMHGGSVHSSVTCIMSAPAFAWQKASYPASLAAALRAEQVRVITCDRSDHILPRLITSRAPTILHLHWLHEYSHGRLAIIAAQRSVRFAARLHAARLSGARIVWTAHNLHDHELVRPRLDRALNKLMASYADAIIAHSEAARQTVVDHFRVSSRKVRVVPHGSYVESHPNIIDRRTARGTLGIDQECFSFLCFGMIRPYKGLSRLIDVFQTMKDPHLRLRIVGRAFDRAALTELHAASAPDPRIEIEPGFVPDEDVQLHMNAADAVVLPYEDVLTSGAAVMAMSFGKVCVAPQRGTLIDVFAPEGVFHYGSDSPGDLYDALQACVVAAHELPGRGALNLNRARAWSWASVARETRQVYERLLADPPGQHHRNRRDAQTE